jgi:hypothetical protein
MFGQKSLYSNGTRLVRTADIMAYGIRKRGETRTAEITTQGNRKRDIEIVFAW